LARSCSSRTGSRSRSRPVEAVRAAGGLLVRDGRRPYSLTAGWACSEANRSERALPGTRSASFTFRRPAEVRAHLISIGDGGIRVLPLMSGITIATSFDVAPTPLLGPAPASGSADGLLRWKWAVAWRFGELSQQADVATAQADPQVQPDGRRSSGSPRSRRPARGASRTVIWSRWVQVAMFVPLFRLPHARSASASSSVSTS